MAYDRQSETIRVAGEAMGSDREREYVVYTSFLILNTTHISIGM